MSAEPYSLAGKRLWVAGHTGMVGASLVRRLQREDVEILTATRQQLDLTCQRDVEQWIGDNKPDGIFLAAAKVGGIHANDTLPAQFLYDNLAIQSNVIHSAYRHGVARLLFLGSSCIYPRACPQPMREEHLLTGPLEATNQWYAIAKIAGLKLCQAYSKQYGCSYIATMPTNLYGPGDNYHPLHSHVPAALLRRFHEAKQAQAARVVVWGSGKPLREFLHVDDLAEACIFLMKQTAHAEPVNIGTGKEISIRAFAETVARIVGYSGSIEFDNTKPDGSPRKLLDVSRMRALGWTSTIDLQDGLQNAYQWFIDNQDTLRSV
ncbi:MAG: GDP-L-fucose synthase [Alphaproteobacteria bacterium GM202ARS2]|nr:GDP-L-fucose synthase [Alphaproteobacteria bacterium GM202ARS2]